MNRQKRQLQKNYFILCEGSTEYNYFNGLKKEITESNVTVKIKNIQGGGYSNIIKEIEKIGRMNYFAIFVICDGDKAENIEEQKQLENLIKYCQRKNKTTISPCFLIVNSPDFEYISCLHDSNYSGGDSKNYIKNLLGYKDLKDFKSDVEIYVKLNTDSRSYKIMIKKLQKQPNKIVKNIFEVDNKKIAILATESDLNSVGKKGSNINEIFEILIKN